MAQHDYNIANQSFPATRTDINNALSAINSSNSGASRPSGAVAGTIWLDTSGGATAHVLKFYDGGADISLATINTTANTVNFLDSEIADDSVTLAKMASGTDGNIISYDASGNPVAVATGSAGQVLTSAGAGAPPTFASAGVSGISSSADATAITIDSSENVLINTTNTDPTGNNVTGVAILNSDEMKISEDGLVLDLNRKGSTGGIVHFRHDGTHVGSIGVTSGGASISLGGTDTAHTLDDYEEGTFTPGTNIGFSSVVGEYVKIGKMVHFAIQGTFNAGPGDGSQATSITGLPFSASPGDQLCEIWVVTHNEHVIGQVGGTGIGLKGRGDGVNLTRGQIGSKGFQACGTFHIDL